MQRRAVLLALVVPLACGASAPGAPSAPPAGSRRILFVGNSLTASNDLPGLLQALGLAAGAPFEARAVVRGGFSLEDHWNEGTARRQVQAGGWSFVVLQQGPSALPESQVLLREYVRRFDEEIRRAGARTAVYMVWPSEARSSDFDGVSASYRRAAEDVDGVLLPAGDVWRAAWRRDPHLPLYDADRFHPSALGTYAAALAMVRPLLGVSPVGLPARISGRPSVSDEQARLLQEAADELTAR